MKNPLVRNEGVASLEKRRSTQVDALAVRQSDGMRREVLQDAAVGITAGLGRELSALLLGLLGWFILSVLGRWDLRIAREPGQPKS